ncbi:4-hydroxy-tetrahydrodipicolinate synthase [Candidatus Albibeggiatoa sp. nov. NOAA]|uniref:4-hydroxy-tetrahydrodipicolinate synthase n=1 Tax=Candidatus Albibeggiatoa sp. nov. NOAA TaxID=3162724 RepID=UPI0032FA3A6D|nr:4-hydroxy-tetrahydrodipicolinate synthase [Thiotrichaceae bacterium]
MFQGSIVALVTPMTDDGQVNYDSLRGLVEFHIENQTDALVAVGTTGESATLNHKEHGEVIRKVIEFANKRVPVIAGTGSNSTAEAIELSQQAQADGADACLLVTPYYNKPTQEGLYQHYKAIAEALEIPVILYNVPGRTACDMLPETVKRLSTIKNIVGIKEAWTDTQRIKDLACFASDDFVILSGDDATALDVVYAGGKGTISVTANVAPKMMHEMIAHGLAGRKAEAEELNQKLMGLHKNLFVESNPIPVKYAVHKLGLMGEGIRLPLLPLSEEHRGTVDKAMQQADINV